MKYYIATSLSRMKDHNLVRDSLSNLEHEITYDWTLHGDIKSISVERLREVAICEMNGVMASVFVLALLPGGKGTHFELGFAIASGKKIFLHSEDPTLFEVGPQTNAFYHHPILTRLCCPLIHVAATVHSQLMDEGFLRNSIKDRLVYQA